MVRSVFAFSTVTVALISTSAVAGSSVLTVEQNLNSIGIALDQYYMSCGRYPSSKEGLVVLIDRQEYECWDGPYLRKNIFEDSWGREIQYRSPSIEGGFHYDLFSYGEDGVSNTVDDINNWDENKTWRGVYRKKRWKASLVDSLGFIGIGVSLLLFIWLLSKRIGKSS